MYICMYTYVCSVYIYIMATGGVVHAEVIYIDIDVYVYMCTFTYICIYI